VAAGKPNPTKARSLQTILGGRPVINVPGCPVHPDWLVGTIAYILKNLKAPPLDRFSRPTQYFGATVHDLCPYLSEFNSRFGRRLGHADGKTCFTCHSANDREVGGAHALTDGGCLYSLGCKGRVTSCDCSVRRWNAGAKNGVGINWCVEANSPCIGCTEPGFPDVMSPFYTLSGPGVDDDEGEGDDDEHDDD
jgi:hydrogenase small subunit